MIYSVMRNWELQLATDSGDRRESVPYRVGGEWLMDEFPEVRGPDDLGGLMQASAQIVAESAAFYRRADGPVEFRRRPPALLEFASRGVTREDSNRTALVTYRPIQPGCPMVLALPPWNTARWSLRRLMPIARMCGMGSAALSLPYQDERRPEGWSYAHGLCSADIGMTIRSMQQGVLDAMDAISVLQQMGHRDILLAGFSIGSGLAALVDMHDARPAGVICVLCADSFADCTWRGISTVYIRRELERHINLNTLRKAWMPMHFARMAHRLSGHPRLLRAMATARFDYTFPQENCRRFQVRYRSLNVPHSWTRLPCGHYTLSVPPFSIRFALWLRNRLREFRMALDGVDPLAGVSVDDTPIGLGEDLV